MGVRAKGILDIFTEPQRKMVIHSYSSGWVRIRPDQHNNAAIRSLVDDRLMFRSGNGTYEFPQSVKTAVNAHLKELGALGGLA